MNEQETGRSYARLYKGVAKRDPHSFLETAIKRAGGRVIASTGPNKAPLFLGIQRPDGSSLVLCAYAFRATHRATKNRPPDEHRFQLRYGDVNDSAWKAQDHSIGFDPLGADTTLVLGVHEAADLLIGVDPLAYDPLPLGISIFFKNAQIEAANASSWHVWERDNLAGALRGETRTPLGLETVVAFNPERIFDYIDFEHAAQRLHLDPALRFRAAETAGEAVGKGEAHLLEEQFDLTPHEILDIIEERPRLGMAVRGGVAERHLQKALEGGGPFISNVNLGQADGPPDLIIDLSGIDGRVSIECKNASPKTYADGTPKVETQKTRASKTDPKSRLYEPAQFDLLAACMFGPLGVWEFRYKRSDRLLRDSRFEDRIAPIQRIDASWSGSPLEAMREP
jgi:hypothetical protein